MPSEYRLHPASILFNIGGQARQFAIPLLVVLIGAGTSGERWQLFSMVGLVPYTLFVVTRYFSYRYRYGDNEIVIRSGVIFKNERHIPYARIQNLDAVQNVVHRMFGVVDVRLETGAGHEPEATMSVLPWEAYQEMRRRVFESRELASLERETVDVPAAAGHPLLHLSPRDLLICGFIENRGVVVIGAGLGLLWELGPLDALFQSIFGEETSGRGVVRDLFRAVFGQGEIPLDKIALTLAGLLGILLFVRLVSMGWAAIRLYDFRLTRIGEDLRTEYGLFTRVTATIPLQRIQTLTIRDGPLHRLFDRTSLRVETAGGQGKQGSTKERAWLAPIIRRDALPGLVREILPELDVARISWNPVHPRAFRRAVKGSIAFAVFVSMCCVLLLKWWDLALLALLIVWAGIDARLYVTRLGWAADDDVVVFRSGWYWRQLSATRFSKIQAVSMRESPFDRRHAMAAVRVDSAGAGDASHRISIPYLAQPLAADLFAMLSAQAARTAFRW